MDNDKLVTPIFKVVPIRNEAKSKEAGRPIFEDVEMVEVRIAGDRNFMPCFPAHSFWKNIDGIPHTYAMRWPEQYRRFKEGLSQTAEGTPLEELPFLTQAKRMELKALSVYTAEALATLDGRNLKALGIGGRELKDQAQAYLDNARGNADVIRMAAEIAALKQRIAEMGADRAEPGPAVEPVEDTRTAPASPFADWSDEDLKAWIKEETGAAPRGNPSHDTLVRMAEELQAEAA